MPTDETVIGAIEQVAGIQNAVFGFVVKLSLKDKADGVSHHHHSAHARCDGFGQLSGSNSAPLRTTIAPSRSARHHP